MKNHLKLKKDWGEVICNWDANGYRLPTEMEWMWAAMGADQDSQPDAMQEGINRTGWNKPFAGYNGDNIIDDYAWYKNNSRTTSHPVGTKLPNELGIYDMSGNIREWCWDWVLDDEKILKTMFVFSFDDMNKKNDGPSYKVYRGGSWGSYNSDSVINFSYGDYPSSQANYIGFRIARNAEPVIEEE